MPDRQGDRVAVTGDAHRDAVVSWEEGSHRWRGSGLEGSHNVEATADSVPGSSEASRPLAAPGWHDALEHPRRRAVQRFDGHWQGSTPQVAGLRRQGQDIAADRAAARGSPPGGVPESAYSRGARTPFGGATDAPSDQRDLLPAQAARLTTIMLLSPSSVSGRCSTTYSTT